MGRSYHQVQRGLLHFFMGLCAGGFLAVGLYAGPESPLFITHFAIAGTCMFLSGCFIYLRVWDEGDSLGVRFGPVNVFGTSIPYDLIESVRLDRTTFLDGLGVHGLPFHNAVFNIRFGPCVRVTLKRRYGMLRARYVKIGTADPNRLAAFLLGKISKSPAQPPDPADRPQQP